MPSAHTREIVARYFHVLAEIEVPGKRGATQTVDEYDKSDLEEIRNEIVAPYLRKEEFTINGYNIQPAAVRRLVVKKSDHAIDKIVELKYDRLGPGILAIISREQALEDSEFCVDITKDVKKSVAPAAAAPSKILPVAAPARERSSFDGRDFTRVFIVHGHDDLAKNEMARFVEKCGFTAVILHEQENEGQTIIEKIERHTNVGFAIVLYTPDDVGGKKEDKPTLRERARQNVVFEHGYLIGKLGRKSVAAVVKGAVEKPNDISGVVYTEMDRAGAWMLQIAKEMKAVGYSIDANRLI